ncbi:hypothetical protein ILUMI_17946 [Ignelater luminosus]|uniref:Uncharacterized protein n=1 Tax=Ignelater luminosus TaxID=2038154 RepID=A0A8K0G719_IGNLU|nr:hypothetical protein ILUMI_17946 [Ignelater luminosus]
MLPIIICLLKLCVLATCLSTDGYYWRDYYGTIPDDAFIGGHDIYGRPIHVGQILHGKNLLTAKIYQNDKRAFYSYYGSEYSSTRDVKILCTLNAQKFEWITTTHDTMHLLTGRHILNGGFEPGHQLYIGRTFHNQEAWIGRIVAAKIDNLGLYIPFEGRETNIKSFEILTYNENRTVLGL